MNLYVNMGYHILSDIDNRMTVAFSMDGKIYSIVAGKSDEIYEKIQKVFG